MFKPLISFLPLAAAVFAFSSSQAWAQTAPGDSGVRLDPTDSGIAVPRVQHQSAFAGYRAFSEQEVKDWRESNDNVGRIGGWRVYAQETRPGKPAVKNPPEPAVPAAAPKPAAAAKSLIAPPVRHSSGSGSAPNAPGNASDAHQHN